MSAQSLFSKGNEEYVNENYQKALELYTDAIKADDTKDEYFVTRAQVYIKLEQYENAVRDADTALKINSQNSKAYLRKGTALFYLEKYLEAKDSFQAAQAFDSENDNLKTWIRKCEAEIDLSSQNIDSSSTKPVVGVCDGGSKSAVQSDTASQSNPPSEPPAMPSGPKTRYDWYQTQTHVVVSIMLKKVKPDDAKIQIQEKSISATIKLPTGSDYSLELDLAHRVNPEKSSTKCMSTKIEIKMKKEEEIRWEKLEGDGETETSVKQFTPQDASGNVNKYPSSSHYTRNWDKVVSDIKKEEEEEKPEGDAAVNSLFQKIFADGTDDTKKAMMKSFYESGGTVLSTNWNEVNKEKVQVKPPDGMEYKKWEY